MVAVKIKHIKLILLLTIIFGFVFWTGNNLNATDSYISIDQYYHEKAVPVKDPSLPKELRYRRWNNHSSSLYIFTQKGEAPYFPEGIFTAYFFDDKYNTTLKEIFSNDGYDTNKIETFFLRHRNEKRVQLYKEGYLLLKDQRRASTYVIPLSEDAIQEILKL
ncbi:MAG: hypothetical protein GY729_12475 [Desulfobacteraceae bacterium]|nr:hypothetical protein [Desulfobacteraceae bacterium]